MAATYDFHTLSPLDFEELARDLLQAEWNVKLESFGPGRDNGVDARLLKGDQETIIQAKHLLGSGYRALLRTMRQEAAKVLLLNAKRYVLCTSVSLTRANKNELVASLSGIPLTPDDIFGREDLNNLLRKHSRIEQSHFKLWLSSSAVLERILQSGVYNRTAAEMDIIQQLVPKFVHNGSVDEAESKLDETGSLIIAGPPGVGKTTLARILLWLHAQQGWKVFVVDSVEDAISVAEVGEKRLILLDDFLGQVRLSADLVRGVDSRLPPLLSRVAAHNNLRFILTTRDYILAEARGLSARLSSGNLRTREYVLNVGSYTRAIKAQIFYNHIYFSSLSSAQQDSIIDDDFFLEVIDHRNFNPRLVEEITSPDYLSLNDTSIRETIRLVLEKPELLWERPYRQHMSHLGRVLMLAMFVNGRATGVQALKASFVRVARALGTELHSSEIESSFRATYRTLDGSVLGLSLGLVSFANPGIRDFLQSVIIDDCLVPALVDEIETVKEINELFAVFLASDPTQKTRANLAPCWTAALDRLQATGVADLDDYIKLSSELCAELDYYPLRERLETALVEFEEVEFCAQDSGSLCALIELSFVTDLPEPLQQRFRNTVSNVTADFLQQFANELSLEDIQSLDEALHEFGSDKVRALEASHYAMESIERYIDEQIREINTIEDLDDYEQTLIEFLVSRSYRTDRIAFDIQYRRDRLYEEGAIENQRSYNRGLPFKSEPDISNNQIRSMFRSLKG